MPVLINSYFQMNEMLSLMGLPTIANAEETSYRTKSAILVMQPSRYPVSDSLAMISAFETTMA